MPKKNDVDVKLPDVVARPTLPESFLLPKTPREKAARAVDGEVEARRWPLRIRVRREGQPGFELTVETERGEPKVTIARSLRAVILDKFPAQTLWPTDAERAAGVPNRPICGALGVVPGREMHGSRAREVVDGQPVYGECRTCSFARGGPGVAPRCERSRVLFLALEGDKAMRPYELVLSKMSVDGFAGYLQSLAAAGLAPMDVVTLFSTNAAQSKAGFAYNVVVTSLAGKLPAAQATAYAKKSAEVTPVVRGFWLERAGIGVAPREE